MFGPEKKHILQEELGVIPRCIQDLFNLLHEDASIRKFSVHMAFIQIYSVTNLDTIL